MTEECSAEEWFEKQRGVEATLSWTKEPPEPSESLTSIVTSDGDVYEGCAVDGQKQGRGKAKNRDGSAYEGSWLRNCYHGTGRSRSVDGAVYIGEWIDNVMQVRKAINCNQSLRL
jgi:hypothetical protein